MNKEHHNLSILPPFNPLNAQIIQKGDATHWPQIITGLPGVTLSYSIPGNTVSVGKTDFWSYDVQLFGVNLPDNVGLTGNGLSGVVSPAGDIFVADGIPLTPFPDATPTVENPYPKALVQLKDAMGTVLATSTPVMPDRCKFSPPPLVPAVIVPSWPRAPLMARPDYSGMVATVTARMWPLVFISCATVKGIIRRQVGCGCGQIKSPATVGGTNVPKKAGSLTLPSLLLLIWTRSP